MKPVPAKESERRQKELLRVTLASIGDAVIVTDAQGRVTFMNPEAERLTGWSSSEAIAQPLTTVFSIVNEETGATVENPVEKVIKLGRSTGLANHTVLIAKNGTRVPIDDSAAPIQEPGQELFGVVLVFRDVGEQRAAHLARARLAAIVEFSGDSIITKNLDGIIQTWNKSAEKLFGYSASEIVGRPITTIIPPEGVGEEVEIMQRIRSGHPAARLETIRITKDGRHVPVSVSVSPLRDSDGRVVGASKVLHDISAMVAAREALAEEKELLATTLGSIGDAVISTDAAGVITFLNSVAESVTGWSLLEAIAKPLETVFRIVNEETRRTVENPVARALREGVVVGLANHTVLIRKDGSELPVDDSAAPIRNLKGTIVGCVLVFRDISNRRKAEHEAKLMQETLRAMDRRKNDFLAILAHELRNPLAPVSNAVQLMRISENDPAMIEKALATMERQVAQMSRLIDDLLDVARISRGKIDLRRETIELSDVLRSVLDTARPTAEKLKLELALALPQEPVWLNADPVRLTQVFNNLVNNALKYTGEGGRIRITACLDGSEVAVSVKDSGAGIPAEQLPMIFDMFTQVDRTLGRSQGGLGIGLSLVKELVEMHGGTVAVRSEGADKGSEFIVRLPVTQADPHHIGMVAAARRTVPVPRQRILVVDDNTDGAESLSELLSIAGHTTKLAFDGAEAVRSADEFRPDVVVLDIGLPGFDGYEAARRIRQTAWGEKMFLVALTGWGQEEDRNKSKQAGFDHHLVKPVELNTLLQLLADKKRPEL